MESFIDQVFLLLTTPPGNLTYHLVLSFSIFGALQSSINHWRSGSLAQGKRMVVGLALMLLGQLVLFASAALAWQEIVPAEIFLPTLDRAVTLFSIVIIVWLWAFPIPIRIADAAFVLTLFLLLAFSILGGLWWYQQPGSVTYNGSWTDVMNSMLAMILSFSGLIMLMVRRPNSWGIGMAMLAMLFIGNFIHWLSPAGGEMLAGPVRLMEIAAFPLLLALPQRYPQALDWIGESDPLQTPDRRRYTTDPKVMQSLLSLAGERDPEKFYKDATRTLSQLMLADVCLLALPPEQGDEIIIPSGYNLIYDRKIDRFTLDGSQCPLLANALSRGRKLRLTASDTTPDLAMLAKVLQTGTSGHLIAAPVTTHGDKPNLQIIMLTPYSNREWKEEDLEFLSQTARALSAILLREREIKNIREELKKGDESLNLAQSLSSSAMIEIESLQTKLTESEGRLRQEQERSENLAVLVEKYESLQEEMEQLVIENQELMEVMETKQESIPEIEQYDRELRKALEDVAHLRAVLSDSDKKLMELKAQRIEQTTDENQLETIGSISQELRQPISSIIGYSDILLNESVGILGAQQKKFLDRVRISAKRVENLIEMLASMAKVDESTMGLSPEIVDLSAVIDEAVADMFAHLSDKNIILRVDLPETLPSIHADRDALQQVLTHLLQNAGSVTPVNGEISLHARIEARDNDPAYILFQVTDNGGGIPSDALGRVFTRIHHTETVDIPGIADQGVGLSIVKTLVEAHSGRVWVDSEEGRGSTFSVLLPLNDEQSIQPEWNETV